MKFSYRTLLFPLLIAFFAFTIIRIYLYSRYYFLADEAEYINNAWRVLKGGMPYRDFWLLFSPGEVYLPALLLKLSGKNINILLYSNIASILLTTLFTYLILTTLKCNKLFALTASFLLIMQGEFFSFSVLCLASCFFLLKYHFTNKTKYLLLCGVLAGIALLFRVYQVAPFCIAAFIFLTLRLRSKEQRLKDVMVLVGSAAIPVLIAVVLLFSIAGLMFKAVIIDAPQHGTALQVPYWSLAIEGWNKLFIYHDYSLTNPIQFPLKGLLFMFSDFIADTFLRLIPFIIILFIAADAMARRFNTTSLIKAFLVMWGICYLPYALNLSGNDHIVQAFLPFFLLLCLFIHETLFNQRPILVKSLAVFCITVIAFTTVTKLYNVYKPSPPVSILKTDTGSLSFSNEDSYRTFRDMTDAILANTEKGDYIFSLCWKSPPFYALTERVNPTYYDSPIDLLLRPSLQKEMVIINDLERTKTRLVLVEKNYSLMHNNDVNSLLIMPDLMAFIRKNYKLYRQYPNYEIYLLNH